MNRDFIVNATKVTSFNLTAADFTTLKHKEEIQYLFGLYFFPNFDLKQTLDSVDRTRLNNLIAKLKSESKEMVGKLHN